MSSKHKDYAFLIIYFAYFVFVCLVFLNALSLLKNFVLKNILDFSLENGKYLFRYRGINKENKTLFFVDHFFDLVSLFFQALKLLEALSFHSSKSVCVIRSEHLKVIIFFFRISVISFLVMIS